MANSTVLQLLQDKCDMMGLPTPAALIGATDKSTKQYRAVLLEVIQDLGEFRWQQQTLRRSFTTIAAQDQGLLSSLFGADYCGLVRDSMWNETRHMRVFGPMTGPVWEALQTLPNAGPEFQYFIQRDHLLISPAPVVGETIAAIVESKYNVIAADGVTYKERVTVDSDTLVFPDNVVKRGFEYKWKRQKGESSWVDIFNDYQTLVARNIANDTMAKLSLDVWPNKGISPGIVIPPGSWNVS